MKKEEFERLYEQAEELVNEYESLNYRTAVIAGFFGRNSEKTFTGEQASMILALRYPEKY